MISRCRIHAKSLRAVFGNAAIYVYMDLHGLGVFMKKIIDISTNVLSYASCAIIVIVVVAALINVIGRAFFNSSLKGTAEIVQYGTMLSVALAISRTGFLHRHVIVNIFSRKFPRVAQKVISVITYIAATVIFGGIAQLYFGRVLYYIEKVRLTDTLKVHYSVLNFILMIGFGLAALEFLYEAVISVIALKSKKVEEKDQEE